jgi:hypothetical protein
MKFSGAQLRKNIALGLCHNSFSLACLLQRLYSPHVALRKSTRRQVLEPFRKPGDYNLVRHRFMAGRQSRDFLRKRLDRTRTRVPIPRKVSRRELVFSKRPNAATDGHWQRVEDRRRPAGLYLSLSFVFRPGKPPLYVPWQDIATREGRFLFWNYVELRFRQAPNVYLQISKILAQKVALASGGSWPGDRGAVGSPL